MMTDIDLILDTAQAMNSLGRPERAKQLRALATRFKNLQAQAPIIAVQPVPDVVIEAQDAIVLVAHDGSRHEVRLKVLDDG